MIRTPTALTLLGVLAAVALGFPAVAGADLPDEAALAEKYAPVVRIVEQAQTCGYGERYGPIDVDLLFDEPTVALRGPWNVSDLVKIGPAAADLDDRFEYHLDFPGSTLEPGCDYERWTQRLVEGSDPAVYAHIATEPARPGELALQYWLFYTYNEFNNLHEGDWEMIQLNFEAADARAALDEEPVAVGYSSHEGAERADWGEDKLELVEGTHPVVYPGAGSHANKYTEALYIGSSAEAGVGCDDTRGPHLELRPDVKTISSDAGAAVAAFPWLAFEGRWGELQPAFFNGPTGPNLKSQWTAPISWSEEWRDRSYAVPTGGVFGTSATDFFCSAVARGSTALIKLLRDPTITLLLLGALVALVIFVVTRTSWRPVAPLRLARRRAGGQILSSAGRMYVKHASLFLGIGVLLIPLSIVISVVHGVILGGFGLAGVDTTGESAGWLVLLLVAVGTMLTLLGFALVQAATVCALVEIDQGRDVGPMRAYQLALKRSRPLLAGLAAGVAIWVVLSATGFLVPVAIWLAVSWLLLAQVVELEDRSALQSLRRSSALVWGRWLRVAFIVGIGALLALAAGPLLGALMIFLTEAPLVLLNIVAGVVYALAMPFVALTTAYVYFDARVREELAPEGPPDELPAEIELA